MFQLVYGMGIFLIALPALLIAILLRLRYMFRLEMTLIAKGPCPKDDRKTLITAWVTERTFFTTRKVRTTFRGNRDGWRRQNQAPATEPETTWLNTHLH